MADYKVKRINGGINDGRWGVYHGNILLLTFKRKWNATRDANRRVSDSQKQTKKDKT